MNDKPSTPDTRLIERWLPIAEIGIESLRERTPMTPFPAPMRSRDNLRNVVEGIEAMGKEETACGLGMAMHRKNPRRVLGAIRVLLAVPSPRISACLFPCLSTG